MECSYQSLSHLMDNKTIAIHFETLEKICDVLQCEPGDVIVRKKTRKKVKRMSKLMKQYNELKKKMHLQFICSELESFIT